MNGFRLILHSSIVLIFAVAMPLAAMWYATHDPDRVPFVPNRTLGEYEFMYRWATSNLTVIIFYFINTYYLLPKFLASRRYLLYFIFLVAFFIAMILMSKWAEFFLIQTGKISIPAPYPALIVPMVLMLGIGTSLEMILQWEQQKRKQETIEKEKMAAELSFLKTQINPHFLFNTLNNIYSLAEQKSVMTGQSIVLLSNLMRYILYDTSDGKILFSNEIKHLEEYVALQRMRIADITNVSINFSNEVQSDKVLIEPLIFIPFVENAFKHGISYASRSFVSIYFTLNGNFLVFKIINSKKQTHEITPVHARDHGVGIMNTKRRLELLYPNRHELNILDELDCYSVSLTIELSPVQDFKHKGS